MPPRAKAKGKAKAQPKFRLAKSQRQTARREAVREHKSEALFKETSEPPSLQPSQPAFGAFTSVAALFGFRTCRSHRLRCRRTIGRRGWRVNLTTRLAPNFLVFNISAELAFHISGNVQNLDGNMKNISMPCTPTTLCTAVSKASGKAKQAVRKESGLSSLLILDANTH